MKIHVDWSSKAVEEETLLDVPSLLENFQDFRKRGRSVPLIVIFNCLFSFLYSPYELITFSYKNVLHSPLFKAISICELFFYVIAIISSWIFISLLSATKPNLLTIRHRIKSLFLLSLTIYFSLHYISGIYEYLDLEEEYPSSSLLLLILIPFNATEIFRETKNAVVILQWIIVCIALVFATIALPTGNSVVIFIAFFVMTLLVLLDRYHFTWVVFEANQELQEKIENYTKTALERKVLEMRDMIGNVAHDLKTPLTSFMTATEMIQSDVERFKETLNMIFHKDSIPERCKNEIIFIKQKVEQSFQELLTNVTSSINSIHDIHLFMLMMINRGIDFQKASKGIELIPMKETVKLSELISMPVQCIRNIQSKITILTNEIPASIHLFIKTDKQWLQENLLCVLSNAVKHSVGDAVQLNVSLVTAMSLKKKSSRVIDEVVVKNRERRRNHKNRGSKPTEAKNSTSSHSSLSSAFGSTSRYKPNWESDDATFRKFTTALSSTVRSKLKKSSSSYEINNIELREQCGKEPDPVLNAGSAILERSESAEDVPISDTCLLFEIIDSGIGLSTHELITFFNPFKQKRLSGGTGLGLYSLAKRIEALGGQYGVQPKEDGSPGSVVWFAIPYQPDYDLSGPNESRIPSVSFLNSERTTEFNTINHSYISPTSYISSDHVISDPFTTETEQSSISAIDEKIRNPYVLMVEDSPTIVKMTSLLLKRQNIDIEIAENGQIALDKVIRSYEIMDGSSRKFDAILMDFQMPVMDGIEATTKIREYEKAHGITDACRIIGISAVSDTEVIDRGLKSGMNAFIPKPFSYKNFASYIIK